MKEVTQMCPGTNGACTKGEHGYQLNISEMDFR